MSELPAVTQAHYQVRYDVGLDGFDRIAATADVVVWVDALPSDDSLPPSSPVPVILADLRNRSAVAAAVLQHQVAVGERVGIAIVAASAGVEDALAAGAVIEALQTLGIDFSSPEAAVVCSGFSGLKRAVGHLVSASIAGQEFTARLGTAELVPYGRLDSVAEAEFVAAAEFATHAELATNAELPTA